MLCDVVADALIFDAPYSARTHGSKARRTDGSSAEGCAPGYDYLTPDDVHAFVTDWSPRCRGWMVSITDDVLAPVWRAAYCSVGRYAFAAVPCVITGMTADSMLALPRPMTRADCGQEARPCPWVGCRHHLAIEVAESKGTARKTPAGKSRAVRPTSLRLNRPSRGRVTMGRRPGLASTAAHLVVQRWIDDAVEQLSSMMYTCCLDVVRDYPDGLAESSVAFLLGVTEQAVNQETRGALRELRVRLYR